MAHARMNLQRMLAWIEERLGAGESAPADAEICERFGFTSSEQARTLLAELADAGRITIRGYGEGRAIALGRARGKLPAPPRPVPSVQRRDPELEAGLAKIAAIVARGRPAPVPTPAPVQSHEEEHAMSLQADVRNITIQARGELREIIETRAAEAKIALGQAARELVEAGLRAEAAPVAEPAAAEPDGSEPSTVVFLSNVPNAWLAEEIARRMGDGVGAEEHAAIVVERDAAIARAESAEGQLATLRTQLRELLPVNA